jgi:hypothetical protein
MVGVSIVYAEPRFSSATLVHNIRVRLFLARRNSRGVHVLMSIMATMATAALGSAGPLQIAQSCNLAQIQGTSESVGISYSSAD